MLRTEWSGGDDAWHSEQGNIYQKKVPGAILTRLCAGAACVSARNYGMGCEGSGQAGEEVNRRQWATCVIHGARGTRSIMARKPSQMSEEVLPCALPLLR